MRNPRRDLLQLSQLSATSTVRRKSCRRVTERGLTNTSDSSCIVNGAVPAGATLRITGNGYRQRSSMRSLAEIESVEIDEFDLGSAIGEAAKVVSKARSGNHDPLQIRFNGEALRA